MSYRHSQIDRSNAAWFAQDHSRATLQRIRVQSGPIRGVATLDISFRYPITAIAGRNGSGKTTVLALAACAFHNKANGFKLRHRHCAYYTFSDFFIQSAEEVALEGVEIGYWILHDNWRKTAGFPLGRGLGYQSRKKGKGGRWNGYGGRVHRNVAYLGIDRVLPHAEKSVSKTYRRAFQVSSPAGWEEDARQIAGRVLRKEYTAFQYKQHNRYRLSLVSSGDSTYSGFNMGAGEDALFGLLAVLLEIPSGSLVLIDELELGLHEEAQERLVDELKLLCAKKFLQIVCTTHSPRVLEALPPEGRVFIERAATALSVIPGISPEYATGKLGGRANPELTVLVEDDASRAVLAAALSRDMRSRIRLIAVGSSTAVAAHLGYRYKEQKDAAVLAFFDGDMTLNQPVLHRHFESVMESRYTLSERTAFFQARAHFLPGTEPPELWVAKSRSTSGDRLLMSEFSLTPQDVDVLFATLQASEVHSSFHRAAEFLQADPGAVMSSLSRAALFSVPTEEERLRTVVARFLS